MELVWLDKKLSFIKLNLWRNSISQ